MGLSVLLWEEICHLPLSRSFPCVRLAIMQEIVEMCNVCSCSAFWNSSQRSRVSNPCKASMAVGRWLVHNLIIILSSAGMLETGSWEILWTISSVIFPNVGSSSLVDTQVSITPSSMSEHKTCCVDVGKSCDVYWLALSLNQILGIKFIRCITFWLLVIKCWPKTFSTASSNCPLCDPFPCFAGQIDCLFDVGML